ncbi:MAG: sulfatase-like hydrolase/transferase, partial [Terriglobales bacterium]
VVGWYLPYCRMLAGDLSCCSWQSMDEPPRGEHSGLAEILVSQLAGLLPLEKRRNHLAQYRALLEEARQIVARPGAGLILVHLPPPHEPAIYDRRSGDFTLMNFRRDWYLDNLALADRTLGELRRAMEQAGVWEQAYVLVTADHSLRYYRGFNTRTDPRVPFLLKLPGQTEGMEYTAPFHAIAIHDLILALLGGEITAPQDVARWLDARVAASVPPKR